MSTPGTRCPSCRSLDRSEMQDGAVWCTDCSWVLATADGSSSAMTELVGSVLPEVLDVWQCATCGDTSDADGRCGYCGQETYEIRMRTLTRVVDAHAWPGPGEAGTELAPRAAVASPRGALIGTDPFTLLHVLDVHDSGEVDVVDLWRGTTWRFVDHAVLVRV